MLILQKYILRQTAVTLIMTVTVFTVVLLLAGVVRQWADLLIHRQIGWWTIVKFVLLAVPGLLSYTLPMAMLATALLVFGRLSADHELTAMRASGMGLWQIGAPVVAVGLVLSAVCFYLNGFVAPQCRYQMRTLLLRTGIERPLDLLEEGRYQRDFPGYVIYVGRKLPDSLANVVVYSLDDQGRVVSSLRAARATVQLQRETNRLVLDLQQVRGDLRDPEEPTNPRRIRAGTSAQRYPLELDLSRILRKARATRKLSDYTLLELRREIGQLMEGGIFPAAALLEGHQRVSLAVACVAFTLIGIPLGIKTNRRETSVGIALSLGLAMLFYFVIITANAVKDRPALYPDAMVWAPNFIFELVGFGLLWRMNRM
ncbi:MAG: LptF/LptG family permease [Verrucomicrobiae bacterium]|nr:LptF/LptG family permease [Verrucomicrobiae bacterium]